MPPKWAAPRPGISGFAPASSEWIAFLDDDDEWLPGKIAAQLAAARLAHAPQPVLSSQVIVRTEACDWISPQSPYHPAEPVSEFLFCRTRFFDSARYMQTSTLLMKRALMRELPFRPGLKRHQDWDWLLRASARSDVGFHMVPKPLAVFHAQAGKPSLSHALDWQFSADWAREMRPAFTARAYAFFLANECLSRAVKARAGGAVYARLIGESFAHGRPAPRSLLSMAGFLCLSEPMRHRLRQRARGARTHPHPAPSWPASLGV